MKQHVHEIFKGVIGRAEIDSDFLPNYLNNQKSRKFIVFFLNAVSVFLFKREKSSVDYIFYGCKYKGLIDSLNSSKKIIIGGFSNKKITKDLENTSFVPLTHIANKVFYIFKTDPLLKKKSTIKLINKTVEFFKETNPKFLIVPSDLLFTERFLIFCARKAGIPSICIQHGLLQSASHPNLLDGKYADYMYAWSEKQKNILVQAGVPLSKIHILGYPHKILAEQIFTKSHNELKVCIFGQPWENYNIALGIKKKKIFNQIVSTFNNCKIIYKPHPLENNREYFPDNIEIFKGTLSEVMLEYDYFISLTSTALLEVSLSKKIAIQFFDKAFECDDFQKIGISYTYKDGQKENIRKYISGISKSFDIKEKVCFLPNDIGKQFIKLEERLSS